MVPRISPPPVCDFCGANLFLTIFECTGGCGADDISRPRKVSPVLCPSCYVEGRTCICGNMTPSYLRKFSTVLNHRNLAVAAIRRRQGLGVEDTRAGLNTLSDK
jgi:hypothetical protein